MTRCGGERGFTLIELALVMLLLALTLGLVLPTFFRPPAADDPMARWSLWQETALERAVARGEVVLIEIDLEGGKLRAVQPYVGGDMAGEGGTTLVPLEDEILPAELTLDPAELAIDDVQAPDGTRVTEARFYVVVLPSGWIDPYVVHVRDAEGRLWSGLTEAITGRVDWRLGYLERIRAEE